MTEEPWTDIGITGESQFIKLLFEPYSKSLIAQFYRSVGDNHGVKALYVRSIESARYRRLAGPSDTLSYENAVLSPCGPFAFVNILQARKESDKYCGYDWYALHKIGLPTGEVISEIKDGQLQAAKNSGPSWISALHGVSGDGNTVYCTVGIQDVQVKGSIKMRYHIAALDFVKKSLELLTELSQIHL